MERKFRVLRIIGTLWKVLAWIELIGGILLAVGLLLVGLLGNGSFVLRLFERGAVMPGAIGIVGSIVGFIVTLVSAIISFLILYALGELIFLLLAIEENTRRAVVSLEQDWPEEAEGPTSPPPPSA